MSKKLKNCPFCSAGWILEEKDIEFVHEKIPVYEKGFRVRCNGGCNARTTWWHTKKQAIKAWNTRQPVSEERIREAISKRMDCGKDSLFAKGLTKAILKELTNPRL